MDDSRQQKQIDDLTAILEVARRLGADTELDPLLRQIIDSSLKILDAERASLFLYEPATKELVGKITIGEPDLRVPADRGIVGESASTRRIINVADAYGDSRFNPEVDRRTGFRTRNILAAPLMDHEGELVGVVQMLNKRGGPFTQRDELLASALSAQAGVALQRTRLIADSIARKRLERELDIARDVQQACLPTIDPELPGFDVAGWNRPADQTGGDCYDFHRLPDGKMGVFLADATGHGIGPALVVAECRALFRSLLEVFPTDIDQILVRANRLLCEDLKLGHFVTAVLGVLDPGANAMTFSSAGHGPLLHYRRADEEIQSMNANGLPLGVIDPLELSETRPIVFEPGDIFVLLTDGFFECADSSGEQLGISRMSQLMRSRSELPARGLIDLFREQVSEFTGGSPQEDDLTIVVIKRNESDRAP
jgi:phosphoserine phosphatase